MLLRISSEEVRSIFGISPIYNSYDRSYYFSKRKINVFISNNILYKNIYFFKWSGGVGINIYMSDIYLVKILRLRKIRLLKKFRVNIRSIDRHVNL